MNDVITIIVPYGGKDPWEKMENETPRAFSAFKVYRDLPAHNRSLAKAVLALYGKATKSKLRQFQTWSPRYHWVDRAFAWDVERDRQGREAQLSAIREMNERQVAIGKAVQQKAIERLREFDQAELTPELMIRFIQVGMQLERIALGQPTEITETLNKNLNATINYSEKTDAELREIIGKQLG